MHGPVTCPAPKISAQTLFQHSCLTGCRSLLQPEPRHPLLAMPGTVGLQIPIDQFRIRVVLSRVMQERRAVSIVGRDVSPVLQQSPWLSSLTPEYD